MCDGYLVQPRLVHNTCHARIEHKYGNYSFKNLNTHNCYGLGLLVYDTDSPGTCISLTLTTVGLYL